MTDDSNCPTINSSNLPNVGLSLRFVFQQSAIIFPKKLGAKSGFSMRYPFRISFTRTWATSIPWNWRGRFICWYQLLKSIFKNNFHLGMALRQAKTVPREGHRTTKRPIELKKYYPSAFRWPSIWLASGTVDIENSINGRGQICLAHNTWPFFT